jgi:hypothetical protein
MQLILMQFGAHSYATHVYFIHESMVSSFLLKKTYTKSLVYVLLSNIYASASFEDEVNSDNEKGRDFIAPSKYVHQECLDHWLSVKKGFTFACCTTCMASSISFVCSCCCPLGNGDLQFGFFCRQRYFVYFSGRPTYYYSNEHILPYVFPDISKWFLSPIFYI